MIKVNFKSALKTINGIYQANKAEIFTGAGITFMVAATVTAVVATVKTMKDAADIKQEMLDEIKDSGLLEPWDEVETDLSHEEWNQLSDEAWDQYNYILTHPVPAKTLLKRSWKHWVAPVGFEIGGAVAEVGSNRISAKKILGLTSTLAYEVAENKNLRSAIKDVVGQEKADEIEDRMSKPKDDLDKNDAYRMMHAFNTGTGDTLYKEYYSGVYFVASPSYIDNCVIQLRNDIVDAKNSGEDYFYLYNWHRILGIDVDCALAYEFAWDLTEDTKAPLPTLGTYGNVSGVNEFGYPYRVLRFRYGPNYVERRVV